MALRVYGPVSHMNRRRPEADSYEFQKGDRASRRDINFFAPSRISHICRFIVAGSYLSRRGGALGVDDGVGPIVTIDS